jgi:endonuclease YncB( thermonuclease family)
LSKISKFRGLLPAALLLIGLSMYQYATLGRVAWFDEAVGKLNQSGGKIAADQINRKFPADGSDKTIDLEGRVVRVADGDTLSLLDSHNKQHKVRLYGIDSPERDQAYGKAAGRHLSKLVANRQVQVVIKDEDDYGRIVGHVFYDGRSVNLTMIESGYAWWYQYHAPERSDFRDGQRNARSSKLGLWQDADPTPPWDWRRRIKR